MSDLRKRAEEAAKRLSKQWRFGTLECDAIADALVAFAEAERREFARAVCVLINRDLCNNVWISPDQIAAALAAAEEADRG